MADTDIILQELVELVQSHQFNHSLSFLSRSREPWIEDVLRLAGKYIQVGDDSTALNPHFSELQCCKDAGNAHLAWYDESTEGEKLQALLHKPLVPLAIKQGNAQRRFYSKAANTVKNATADSFCGRTSIPHFITESNGYPGSNDTVDAAAASKASSAIYCFRGPRTTKRNDLLGNVRLIYGYIGSQAARQILAKACVAEALKHADGSTAGREWATSNEALFHYVWNGKWIGSLTGTVPEPRENLGREFHFLTETEAAAQLAVVALLGCRVGSRGWNRFSRVLIQGGWPWTHGYRKAYAKSVFATMTSLYAAVDQNKIVENPATGWLLIELARLLVGRAGGGPSGIHIRTNDRLKDAKVRVYGIKLSNPEKADTSGDDSLTVIQHEEASKSAISLRLKSKESKVTLMTVTDAGVEDANKSEAAPSIEVKGWTLAEARELPGPDNHLSFLIINGNKFKSCNHGDNLPYNGRVRSAHTLEELMEHLKDGTGIVVAQTLGDEKARDEVAEYVINERILTVRRTEGQCIYCACRTAHCVGALVVIG